MRVASARVSGELQMKIAENPSLITFSAFLAHQESDEAQSDQQQGVYFGLWNSMSKNLALIVNQNGILLYQAVRLLNP